MQDGRKAVWSFSYVSVTSLKHNSIAYRSSSRPDCICTSCDNQALVGCIPIAEVAVHLKLKS